MVRISALLVVPLLCLSLARPGFAQKAGSDTITADQGEIGKLQTRVEKFDQAPGVVIQLARSHGENVECNAVCYYLSSSKPIAWRRAGQEMRPALHDQSAGWQLQLSNADSLPQTRSST
jgi:hypothetical protein